MDSIHWSVSPWGINVDLPPNLPSSLTDPDSPASRPSIVIGICIPLITIVFLCRAYFRAVVERVWEFGDWLVLVAWTGTVAYLGIIGVSISDRSHSIAYWVYVASIEYGPTACIVKLSIIWLCRRLFISELGRTSAFNILALLLSAVLISFYGSTTIVKIFECTPRDKIFYPMMAGKCVNRHLLLNICDSFDTITDVLVLFLATHMVWKLQVSNVKKTLIILLLVFGLCAPIFCAIRFAVRLENSTNFDNAVWIQPETLLWGAAELTVGIICVCVPEIRLSCYRTQSRMQSVGILGMSAIARLRRLKGHIDLESSSEEEHAFGSGAIQSDLGLSQQVNGTVHVNNGDVVRS